MNAAIKKPPEQSLEASLKTLEHADPLHRVYIEYGTSATPFYNASSDYTMLNGRLAMPLSNCSGAHLGFAYLSEDRKDKPEYDLQQLEGCVIIGKPDKDKPLYVVSNPEAAFAISHTGLPCLLTFEPRDWGVKNSSQPRDAGNMVQVIKAWSAAGYTELYAPVGCDMASTYRVMLKGQHVDVLPMVEPITRYLKYSVLKSELTSLIKVTKLHQWGAPLTLRDQQTQHIEYPIAAFPAVARAAIEAIAYHVQAPVGLAGQCVLGTLAYIAQIHVNAPHLQDPRGMPCSLYLVTEGSSGDRKSACHNLADKEIKAREKMRLIEYQQAVGEFKAGLAACSKKQSSQFVSDNPLPPNPQSIFSDATIEPIAGAFIAGDIKNGAWTSDEGAQFFAGSTMKGDTAKSALGALTRVFDQGIFERTRARSNPEAGGTAYDIRLMVNLLGQREVLHGALNDPVLRGQGFLPRFIFAVPHSLAGTRFNTIEKVQEQAHNDPRLQKFWAHYGALLPDPRDPISQQHYREVESNPRPVLQLNDPAWLIWLDFYNATEKAQAQGGKYETIKPFAGRAGELALRVATVFAFFEHKTEIDHIAMQGACDVVRHSLNEWLSYTDKTAVDDQIIHAERIERWLVAECHKKHVDSIPLRDAYRAAPVRSARKKTAFLAAINPLIEADRVMIETRNRVEWIAINPRLII